MSQKCDLGKPPVDNCLRNVLNASRRRLEVVLPKKFNLIIRLENVLKTSWRRFQNILKTSWRCLKDVLKMSWGRLENVLKAFWKRLEDVLKMSWRRLEDQDQRRLQDVYKTSSSTRMFAGTRYPNVCWDQIPLKLESNLKNRKESIINKAKSNQHIFFKN